MYALRRSASNLGRGDDANDRTGGGERRPDGERWGVLVMDIGQRRVVCVCRSHVLSTGRSDQKSQETHGSSSLQHVVHLISRPAHWFAIVRTER